jgi:hypothetical protein
MQEYLSKYIFSSLRRFPDNLAALIAGILCLTLHELPLIQELRT